MSNILSGLAYFELFKIGGTILILVLLLCCSLGMTFYTNKTYLTTTGNIVVNTDQSEIVTYYINNQQYTHTIAAVSSTSVVSSSLGSSNASSNIILSPKYPEGDCTIYYNSNDPNDYSINSKPVSFFYVFMGLSGYTCCLILLTSLYFYFLNTHREVAGIQGGISATQDIFSMI